MHPTLLRSVTLATAALACVLPLHSQSNPQLTGNWVGVLDVVRADGSVQPDTAYLALTQKGDELSGSAGNTPAKLSPIAHGRLDGNNVSFDVIVNPQVTVAFRLTLDADRLHGVASGLPGEPGSQITVDTRRADAAWHTATPVPHAPDRLYDTVAHLDQRLFDAYNHCDLATLGAMVTADLEFYHDKTGLTVGRQPFVDSIRDNICGKTERTLVPGSLQVYRLNQYGAVEIGVHRFSHPGHNELDPGEAKFILLWQFKDADWKLTRVISYDHEAVK
jgi:hypothetical protein